MTGLWTNDPDILVAFLQGLLQNDADGLYAADQAIALGAVRVLDPDNTELVDQVARESGVELAKIHAVIEAVRQP
jgi:hypothetical protein